MAKAKAATLSVDSLKEMGAFTGRPTEKQITWKHDGEEVSATVFIRPLSYKTALSDIRSAHEKSDALAGRIASCVCDAEGNPVFTAADITGDADPERGPLDGNLTFALLQAIDEVNRPKTRAS